MLDTSKSLCVAMKENTCVCQHPIYALPLFSFLSRSPSVHGQGILGDALIWMCLLFPFTKRPLGGLLLFLSQYNSGPPESGIFYESLPDSGGLSINAPGAFEGTGFEAPHRDVLLLGLWWNHQWQSALGPHQFPFNG